MEILLMAALLSGCQTRQQASATGPQDDVCGGRKSSRELVYLRYSSSLRLVNGSIEIRSDCAGNLTARIRSFRDGETNLIRVLTDSELDRLKTELDVIDWSQAAKDKVKGIDGSSVRLISGDQEVNLWTPEANTRKRGLEELQCLIETLFEFAGLGPTGLPLKP